MIIGVGLPNGGCDMEPLPVVHALVSLTHLQIGQCVVQIAVNLSAVANVNVDGAHLVGNVRIFALSGALGPAAYQLRHGELVIKETIPGILFSAAAVSKYKPFRLVEGDAAPNGSKRAVGIIAPEMVRRYSGSQYTLLIRSMEIEVRRKCSASRIFLGRVGKGIFLIRVGHSLADQDFHGRQRVVGIQLGVKADFDFNIFPQHPECLRYCQLEFHLIGSAWGQKHIACTDISGGGISINTAVAALLVENQLIPRVVGRQGHALALELGQQAVDIFQGLAVEGAAGEVGLLEILQLPLNGDDGLQVAQGNGYPVHRRHLGQVHSRVGQQGLDLIQSILHSVQNDALVCDQIAVPVQKAQGVQQRIGFLIALAGKALQLLEQALVLLGGVLQQVGDGGVGRPRQQGQNHTKRQQ